MSFISKNPFTRKLLHEVPFCDKSHISNLITGLHNGYQDHNNLQTSRAKKSSQELKRMSSILAARKHDLAKLISLEMGKPISQSLLEVQKAVNHCIHFSENIEKYTMSQVIRTEAYKSGYYIDPIGVVLKIVPFNFPVWIAFKMMVPALAAGNSVLIRPPSQCPLVGLAIDEIFQESGLERARVVMSSTEDTDFILENPYVQGVSFTGSSAAGSKIGMLAGKHLKRSVLELGGSDPFILLEDGDIDKAVEVAAASRLANSGQVCFSSKRFIVHETLIDEFIGKLANKTEEIKSGDPLDPETEMGPLASDTHADDFEKKISEIGDTAELVFGDHTRDGNFVRPLGYKLRPDSYYSSVLAREEIFGPCFPFWSFSETEEALEIANSSKYGLGATLITKDLRNAENVARRIDSGNVFINSSVTSLSKLPCGGVKNSGYGRDCGHHGVEAFANIKTFFISK